MVKKGDQLYVSISQCNNAISGYQIQHQYVEPKARSSIAMSFLFFFRLGNNQSIVIMSDDN